MKKTIEIVAIAALCAAMGRAASIPQAPVVTYGLVRDMYGSPLTTNDGATMKLVKNADPNGTVYASTAVGATAYPGMNYRLSLEIDSEGPTRPYAVVKGTVMLIRCQIAGEDQTLTPNPVFTTPVNGTAQHIDYSLGGDADGDGMPDEWEKWVLELAGRDYSNSAVAAFKPNGDADGDGMTNLQEYLSGTDPFLATDLLTIVSVHSLSDTGRIAVTFTTAGNHTYRLLMTESLTNPNWTPVATAAEPEGELEYRTYKGSGRNITVYTDRNLESMFFKVAVQ